MKSLLIKDKCLFTFLAFCKCVTRKSVVLYFMIPIFIAMNSCKKYLNVDPPKSRVASEVIFSDDVTAIAAIKGIYDEMMNISSFASGSNQSITALAGLTSDELVDLGGTNISNVEFADNNLTKENYYIGSLWLSMYKIIYQSNSIIEGLDKATGITLATKNQLKGEALFARAFSHFYLVNLFGDIPLITTTDYNTNAVVTRTSSYEVFAQITEDLVMAKSLLNDNYQGPGRVRPNKWAATAMLARVYLYLGDWVHAEEEATTIIANSTLYSLVSNLSNVFRSNSTEAIWQIQPKSINGIDGRTNEAYYFDPARVMIFNSLSRRISNSFEPNDSRKSKWIDSLVSGSVTIYYPKKYIQYSVSAMSEYSTPLRLAEQFLIRAEARVQQNNIAGAQSDINSIRNRASLLNTSANDKTSLLAAIENERKVELFTEWGHRWLDLKRWDRASIVLSALKPDWESTDMLYPLPQNEMNINPHLTPQNPGY